MTAEHFAIPCDDPSLVSAKLQRQGVLWHNPKFIVRSPVMANCVVVKHKDLGALLNAMGLGPTDIRDCGPTEQGNCHLLVPNNDPRFVHMSSHSNSDADDDFEREFALIQARHSTIESGGYGLRTPASARKRTMRHGASGLTPRDLFLAVTADDAMPRLERETSRALEIVRKIRAECMRDGVKTRGFLARFDVYINAQQQAQERIAREINALHALGVEIAGSKTALGFSFDTPKGRKRLIVEARGAPRVTDAESVAHDLPADVFCALTGFVARQEFGNAVLLLIGFFEGDEVSDTGPKPPIDMRPFIQVLCGPSLREREAVARQAEEAHESHETETRHLVVALKEYRDRMREFAVTKRDAVQLRERREREFDTMVSHPMVEGVTVDDGWLVVTTNPITVEYDDPQARAKKRYDVGRWHVRISLADMAVIVLPADGQSREGTMLHPHIYNTNTPKMNAKANEVCWGALACDVAHAMKMREFKLLLEYVLLLLGSCNPADPQSMIALLSIGTPLP